MAAVAGAVKIDLFVETSKQCGAYIHEFLGAFYQHAASRTGREPPLMLMQTPEDLEAVIGTTGGLLQYLPLKWLLGAANGALDHDPIVLVPEAALRDVNVQNLLIRLVQMSSLDAPLHIWAPLRWNAAVPFMPVYDAKGNNIGQSPPCRIAFLLPHLLTRDPAAVRKRPMLCDLETPFAREALWGRLREPTAAAGPAEAPTRLYETLPIEPRADGNLIETLARNPDALEARMLAHERDGQMYQLGAFGLKVVVYDASAFAWVLKAIANGANATSTDLIVTRRTQFFMPLLLQVIRPPTRPDLIWLLIGIPAGDAEFSGDADLLLDDWDADLEKMWDKDQLVDDLYGESKADSVFKNETRFFFAGAFSFLLDPPLYAMQAAANPSREFLARTCARVARDRDAFKHTVHWTRLEDFVSVPAVNESRVAIPLGNDEELQGEDADRRWSVPFYEGILPLDQLPELDIESVVERFAIRVIESEDAFLKREDRIDSLYDMWNLYDAALRGELRVPFVRADPGDESEEQSFSDTEARGRLLRVFNPRLRTAPRARQ